MAGGGESGLTDSLLETPTYVLSIVFLMFLAISGAFEISHHFAHKWLVRRGRPGLASALDKLVMELTLLGWVSLILTAFASPLSHICVEYHQWMDQWTIGSGIPGCPCCMASTGGLSYCSMIQHDCMWNVTSRAAFCDCEVTGSAAFYDAPDSDAKDAMTSSDCLASGAEAERLATALHEPNFIFDANEVTFFIESSVNTLATLSVSTNTSVTEICGLIDSEYDLAQARQERGLEAELAEAGIDPDEGIVLPWEESSGWRRRLQAGSGGGGGGGGSRRRRRVHGVSPAAGMHQQQEVAEQPATPLGPHQQHRGRRLLAGDMGDRLTDPLSVMAAARRNLTYPTEIHVLPRAKLFKCTGPFLSSGCPNGKVPAISANSLHQVHIWLFLIAITHVGACVFQFLVAATRILLWRRWERLARQSAMPRSRAALAASTVVPLEPGANNSEEGSGKLNEPAAASSLPPGESKAAADATAAVAAAATAGQAEQGTAASGPGAGAAAAAAGGGSPAAAASSRRRAHSLQRLSSRARFVWKFQPADIHEWGVTGWLMELAICMTQALWPNLVTRHNFVLMRRAWLAAGAHSKLRLGSAPSFGSSGGGDGGGSGGSGSDGDSSRPSFVGHVLDCLEGDLSTFVGLSVEMSICLVVVVLLMGITGNIGGVTLVFLACTLMFLTNVALVAILRHQCRGAQPYLGRGQWWRNARVQHFLLAIPLRLLTFQCSFVFSSTALFAWQFGSKSCFFTDTWGLWSLWDLPWWSGLVVAGVILLWASAATIPAYALAAHSFKRTSGLAAAGGHQHGQPSKQQHALELAGGGTQNGSAAAAELPGSGGSAADAALQAEVGRLQAHVSRLEAQVEQLQARLAAEAQAGEEASVVPAA